jgi:hypothetical protein
MMIDPRHTVDTLVPVEQARAVRRPAHGEVRRARRDLRRARRCEPRVRHLPLAASVRTSEYVERFLSGVRNGSIK